MTFLARTMAYHRLDRPILRECTGFGDEAREIIQNQIRAVSHFIFPISRATSDPFVKFETNKIQWINETKHYSSVEKIAMHPAYQRIIGMGDEAIPFILRELTEDPQHWFWALKSITNVDPVPTTDKGKIKKMALAWLNWGREQGYV